MITEDNLYEIAKYLDIKTILIMRLVSKKMKENIDNSYIWEEKLKNHFRINQDKYHYETYKEKYQILIEFYKIFKFVTPFMNRIFNLPKTNTFCYIDEVHEISNSASTFFDHLIDILWNGIQEENLSIFDKEQIEVIKNEISYNEEIINFNKLVEEACYYNLRNINEYLDLLSGIIVHDHTRKNKLSDHVITDKSLDLFTFVWGGDLSKSRIDKITYIINEQNKLLQETVDAGRDLIGSGEDDLEDYYVNEILLK